MPVNVDKNLTLNNNTMDASYWELFKKLNVAYGWTYTKTTSSNGTAVYINKNREISKIEDCDDINMIWANTNDYDNNQTCILGGKLFVRDTSTNALAQIGQESSWVWCSTCSTFGATIAVLNTSGELFKYTNVTVSGSYTSLVRMNSNNTFSQVAGNQYTVYGISGGKLYCSENIANTDLTEVNSDTDWQKVIYGREFRFIKNGVVYKNPSTPLSAEINNIIDISAHYSMSSGGNNPYGICLSSDGKVYGMVTINNVAQLKQITSAPSNVVKIFEGSAPSMEASIITQDGNLYTTNYSGNLTSTQPTWTQKGKNVFWTDVINNSNAGTLYAISDGKLYSIYNNTLTQIGTADNYQRLLGSPGDIAVAWCGDSMTESHTVYTTKLPQVNDATYIDTDLNIYSTVQSVSGVTITDEYRTYDRDASKDSSFTAIPSATAHETITTSDFLRITNPNE